MRKKILSTLLMGALVTASMSTFTSCKDYDDDINNLQTQIDALTPLKTVKTELQTEIANLQKQLEAKDAQLQEAITKLQTAGEAQTKQITEKVTKLAADVSGLEARVKTAEEALSKVNKALEGKASKEELKELAGKVAAVESNLVEPLKQIKDLKAGLDDVKTAQDALKADIDEQKAALEGYKTRLEALEKQGLSEADIKKIYEKIEEAKKALDKKLSEEISQLKADAKALSDRVDQVNKNVNVLNVLLPTELRSIVFAPDSYYWGIEATKIMTLNYAAYNLPDAAWNKKETKGYDKAERYDAKDGSSVLAFVANYHMNPSTAVLDPATAKVDVLSGDKEYTRAAEAGLSVAGWKVENGMLQVNLDVTNPEKIKSVKENEMVTVFATQVTLPGVALNKDNNLAERTITSDYATLYAESIRHLKLAHRAGDDVPFLGVESPNKSVLGGPDKDHKHHQLLMQHVFEAATSGKYMPQDSVNYNETLDLRKLVEVHYTNAKGVNRLMTAEELEANGMKYKFEITALYLGSNETSESAHAAINPKDGYTFRPQMPEYDKNHVGKQQAYGAEQARPTIGRTPLVRVTLLDKKGNELDYGYIRIKITEKKDPAVIVPDKHIDYQGPDYNYSYNGECVDPATEWKYETKWIQTEYDLYHMLGITREEFEANYGVSPVEDAKNGGLQQYKMSANGKTFEKMAEPIGQAYTRNETSPEDGTLTSILGWKLTPAQAKKLFVTDKKANVEIAVKYESKDKSKLPDVFVVFKSGKRIGTDSTPAGEVLWANNIISNYWYKANTSKAGTDEIHTNTLTPEDNPGGTADKMENTFGDVFKGNKIAASALIKVTKDLTKNKEYATGKLKLNVVFDASNDGKEYKGIDGKTYVMSVADKGKTLNAQIKGNQAKQAVAKLTSPEDPSETKIAYQHGEYAHALLNYKDHNSLANDVVKAIIGIIAQNECAKELPLTNNTFDVRFLRPINAENANKTIEDASYVAMQKIKATDLLKFTDWRDAWNKTQAAGIGGEYEKYYGVEGVTIEGIKDGESISLNPNVMTNLGQSDPKKFVALGDVTKNIDFVYTSADGGTLTYKNLSTTVQEFQIKIPVTVKYIWGYITENVTVTVKKTASNAKKF